MVRYLDPSLATANDGGRFIGSRLELSPTKKAISNKLLDTGKTCVIIECTIAGERYVGLVLSTRMASRRGTSPMVKVQWSGEPPRDYRVEHVEEQLLRPVK
jgi:hypothetical protein